MEVIFLGTGTSVGIPMIGCRCAVCTSQDPRDRRFRASVAVQLPAGPGTAERVIVIDVSPEFRLAAIREGLARVDAILFTHGHADHMMGLDDIRRYNKLQGSTIPCYGDRRTLEMVRQSFGYAVGNVRAPDWPSLSLEELAGPREVCGVTVVPVPLRHGLRTVLGFRIGGLAYCTDCSGIPQESCRLLEGLDLLVIGALRHKPHPAHYSIQQALDVVGTLRPRRTLLTHLGHDVCHARTAAELPPGVELAYDGLRVAAAAP